MEWPVKPDRFYLLKDRTQPKALLTTGSLMDPHKNARLWSAPSCSKKSNNWYFINS